MVLYVVELTLNLRSSVREREWCPEPIWFWLRVSSVLCVCRIVIWKLYHEHDDKVPRVSHEITPWTWNSKIGGHVERVEKGKQALTWMLIFVMLSSTDTIHKLYPSTSTPSPSNKWRSKCLSRFWFLLSAVFAFKQCSTTVIFRIMLLITTKIDNGWIMLY